MPQLETSEALGTKTRTKVNTSPTPPVLPLLPNHLRFVNQYEHQGFKDAHLAYQAVYQCKRSTSLCNAYRLLEDARVQQEIARRIQAKHGISQEFVRSGLLLACDLAVKSEDSDRIRGAYMDAAKLAGFLVEKRQAVAPTPTLTPSQLADELRQRGFQSVPIN